MKKVLTLFFNIDRTYIIKITNDPKGLILDYFNSTDSSIDLDAIHSGEIEINFGEIENIIDSQPIDFDSINLVFPAEAIMTTQIPGKSKLDKDELVKIISVELIKAYPKLNITDFEIEVFQLANNLKGESKQLSVIFQKSDIELFEQLLFKYNKPITKQYISIIAAANAFLYNYPELHETNNAIIGIQNNFMDFCVISNGNLIYYNLLNYPDDASIPDILEKELNKVTSDIVPNLSGGLYFYGSDLTKSVLLSVWEIAMLFGVEGKRLNAFRMVRTNLSKREREYAARTMQIYPACIGGSIPNYFSSIVI
jgi:hypothetical protein